MFTEITVSIQLAQLESFLFKQVNTFLLIVSAIRFY